MSKELEALERLKNAPTFMGGTVEYQACTKSETLLLQDYEIVKQALLELQYIKEANPSKALECLKNMCNDKVISDYILYNCLDEDIVNIKQSLFKELEQEKVLKELIKLIDNLEPTFNRKGISSDTTILGTIIKDYFYNNVSDLTLSYLLKENQQDDVAFRGVKMSDIVKVYYLPEKECKTEDEKLNKDFDDYFTKFLYNTYKEQDISKVIVLSLPEFKNFLFQMLPFYTGFKSPDEVISRAELCEAVDRIFGSEEKFLDIIEEDIPYGYHYYKYEGEEIYIIDTFHNRYINWYKLTHLGRDFHTDMKTKEEVIDFLQNLHDKWLMENGDE